MAEGRMKGFDNGKGNGFIEANQGLGVVVPSGAFEAYGFNFLNVGERVLFAEQRGAQGPLAAGVRKL